jgi:hypothetical protein
VISAKIFWKTKASSDVSQYKIYGLVGKAHAPIINIHEQLHLGLSNVNDGFDVCCCDVI